MFLWVSLPVPGLNEGRTPLLLSGSSMAALTHDLLSLTPSRLVGEAEKSFSQKGVDRTQARWENRG